MQIVSKMESNSESNIEGKSSDKEKVASNDVDFNENLSKQCNGNTMTDVNKNIAKNESLELNDNETAMLKQNKSEGDLSETSENCELHISEGSDVECEKTEDDKDAWKFNGEDKVKTDSNDCDQNDIKETENVEIDATDNKSQETGKENMVDQAVETSDISVKEGTEDTKDKQSESANKANDIEVPGDGNGESPADDKMHPQKENEEINALPSENELSEQCKEKIIETCSADLSLDESGENSKETMKDKNTNSVCDQNSECNDETAASKHIEGEFDEKGHNKKENDTDEKHEGEGLESDHGNSESSNEKASEIVPDLTESEKDLFECGALNNEDSKLENVSESENKNKSGDQTNENNATGSSVDPESKSEMSSVNMDENVSESESKNDQSYDHSNENSESGSSVDPESRSEMTQPSNNVDVKPNDGPVSNFKQTASKDSENNLEHTKDGRESAERENKSINEAKKDIDTEVDTNLSESSTSVNQEINDDISKENQTLDSDQQVLEMQHPNNQEAQDSGVDRSQKDDVASKASKAEAQNHEESDIIEESASTENSATHSENILSENDGNECDEAPRVERKVIDNDQSVQTDERKLETSSTQTTMKESKDQCSETLAKEVGSMETQTVDQKVQCEHKETETDITEHIQKTEVCDKETSISQPEISEQSVQTEAENISSLQREVLDEKEKEKVEVGAEASNQPTLTPSTEQATQTDLQESIARMIQTEAQPTEKEQALEDQTDMLKDELSEAKKMIRDLQAELAKSKASSNYMVTTLKCQLKKSQEMHQAQRCQSDRQMGEVLAHLLFLEGQLKKDKTHIKFLLRQKEDVIQRQKCDIEELKNTNQRLIEAVREHYARKGKNGLSKEHSESIQNAEAEVPCSPKVKVKNRGAFGSVKDIIWKHRSSLDLSEAGMEIQGNLKKDRQYSSQENLFSLGRRNKEARESRDKKCKSIAGYPDHSLEYLIPEESELRDISRHGSASSLKKGQKSGRNVSWGSDNSDVNISYDSNSHLMVTSPSQMMSAGSMPALNKNSNLDLVTKERPHSISSIESLSRENCSSLPGTPKMEEKVPHPVPQESSNPFKNLKTILKRKGSKMKNKKRTVSLSNSANPEYEEAMKKHFEKYEMS